VSAVVTPSQEISRRGDTYRRRNERWQWDVTRPRLQGPRPRLRFLPDLNSSGCGRAAEASCYMSAWRPKRNAQ